MRASRSSGGQQRGGPAVADGEGPGHARRAVQDGHGPEQLVEELGDHPAVHAGGRSLVRVAVEGPAPKLPAAVGGADRPDVHGRRQRVVVAHDGARGEEVLGVAPVVGHAARRLARAGGGGELLGHPLQGLRRPLQVPVVQRPAHQEVGHPPHPGRQAVPRGGRGGTRAAVPGRGRVGQRGQRVPGVLPVNAHARRLGPAVTGAGTPGCASRRTPGAPPWRPRWRRRASRSRAPGPARPPRTCPRSRARTA